MLSAISSSTFTSPFSSGRSAAGLEAQLDQYKIQLADWVNCPSCKTAEGKAKIAEISGKISEVKTRINEAAVTKPNTRPDIFNLTPPSDISANKDALASTAQANPVAVTASSVGSPTATVGSRLDIFA